MNNIEQIIIKIEENKKEIMYTKNRVLKVLLFLLLFHPVFGLGIPTPAQSLSYTKTEPPNWWVGMKKNSIQLMVYGEGLLGAMATSEKQGVKVRATQSFNENYLFIDVEINPAAKAGEYPIVVKKGEESFTINYPLLQRTGKMPQGYSNSDVIYLVMPDRFCNGDTSNDSVAGLSESVERDYFDGRHGGDLQGVIDKLEYIKELGFTALWLTPVVENNTFRSYHGYAATDFYTVDPRLGSNALYQKLVKEANKLGIKVILDHVANHFSKDHPWMKNLPTPDWVNGSINNPPPPHHEKEVFSDIHGDSSTIQRVIDGWFTDYMPDMNETNPFVANYIIQNTIWWVEFAGLDAIREDTYPYNHEGFMAQWAKTIREEYPNINILAEVWTGEPAFLSYYQQGSKTRQHFDNYITSLTDFGLRDAVYKYLAGGGNNMYSVYSTLAMDNLYADANQLVTFIDNHDINRAMYGAEGNVDKFLTAFDLLFTTRGIPQVFYGTEIGIRGTDHHGELRADFPGGWREDTRNAFTRHGRNETENRIYDHIKKLISIRLNNPAFTVGKLIHFPPERNIYVYFREFESERFMVAINSSKMKSSVDFGFYASRLKGVTSGEDLLNGGVLDVSPGKALELNAYSSVILKLK